MTDILLFLRDGWKNLWKQNIIWLFSALPLVNQVLQVIHLEHKSDLLWSFLYLISGILLFINLIAVPYLVYSIATGETVTVEETIHATGIFLWRIIGCSCLGILILSPYIFLAFILSFDSSTQPPHFSNTLTFMSLPISLFAALPYFAMFGFFANGWGVRQSLKKAWTIFTSHFGVLAALGIIMIAIFRACSTASGVLTLLIQSGFDIASLSKLDYINPLNALGSNMLFVVFNGLCRTIWTPFNSSIFVFAYLKYSASKRTKIT